MRRVIKHLHLHILSLIAGGVNQNKLLFERLLKRKGKKIPKSTISRHTSKLVKLGLIRKSIMFNRRQFELTPKGKLTLSNLLAKGEGDLEFPVRGHKIGFRFRIVRRPKRLGKRLVKKGWVEFCPRNWRGYRGEVLGCHVVFTSKSVMVMAPEVYGWSAEQCLHVAWSLVWEVKKMLEESYDGLVLGEAEEVSSLMSQSYARPFDPLAVRFYQVGRKKGSTVTYRSDRIAVDSSKGFPELETVHKVHATEDLRILTDFYEDLIINDFSLTDLLNEFAEVKRRVGMADLLGSEGLSCSFTVRHFGIKDLSCSFAIPQISQ